MASNSLQRLLLYCVICMLAAAVLVTIVALIYHPRKSEEATMLAELDEKLHCIRCSVGIEKHTETCGRCDASSKPRKIVVPDDCSLSDSQKESLSYDIRERIQNSHQENEQMKALADKNHDYVKNLEYLSLNAPRPSAHWYMKHLSSKPKSGEENSPMRQITKWISNTGTELAHSQNGIVNERGQMKFATSGWYEVYFQVDIHSNITASTSFKAQAVLTRQQGVQKIVMRSEKTVHCASKHHQHHIPENASHTTPVPDSPTYSIHTCGSVTLKGSVIYRIFADDLIGIEVEMPNESRIDTRMSRSFFGALYFHQVPPSF